jgi:hypothetical protein
MEAAHWARLRAHAHLLLPFGFALFALAFNACLDFQQTHNDFWDVYFIARQMTWADKVSWFNPQYPIGSCLFLKGIMGSGPPAVPAILANILFAAFTLGFSQSLYRKFMPRGLAIFSAGALALFPEFFFYANAGGGDPAAVAFFAAGAGLLFYAFADPARSRSAWFHTSAGYLIGLAALFRYHALVGGGMLLLALFVVFPRHWKSLALAAAGTAAGYCPQWIVNFAAGRGPLETQFGPMNVYDLMYGLNWYRITELKLPGVAALISADPGRFLARYLPAFWAFKQAYGPPVLAALLEKNRPRRNMFRALALWTLIYFAAFSATTSGRQILLPLPFSMLALGVSLHLLWARFSVLPPRARAALAAACLAALPALSVWRDVSAARDRARHRDAYLAIESHLRENGCSRASQIFSTDFDMYFRALPPLIPYFNGGAPRLGTYRYNEEFPEFPVDGEEAFVSACRRRGVRYVVLNANGRRLSAFLGDVYDGSRTLDGMEPDMTEQGYRVFRIR